LSEEDKTVFGVTDADFRVIHFQLVSTGISTVLFRERRPGSLSELDELQRLCKLRSLPWLHFKKSTHFAKRYHLLFFLPLLRHAFG
jgi:hypothetical protein